jgi:uncharacterized protein YjaG (DUF416 family)
VPSEIKRKKPNTWLTFNGWQVMGVYPAIDAYERIRTILIHQGIFLQN